jgi:hypothetical protein
MPEPIDDETKARQALLDAAFEPVWLGLREMFAVTLAKLVDSPVTIEEIRDFAAAAFLSGWTLGSE